MVSVDKRPEYFTDNSHRIGSPSIGRLFAEKLGIKSQKERIRRTAGMIDRYGVISPSDALQPEHTVANLAELARRAQQANATEIIAQVQVTPIDTENNIGQKYGLGTYLHETICAAVDASGQQVASFRDQRSRLEDFPLPSARNDSEQLKTFVRAGDWVTSLQERVSGSSSALVMVEREGVIFDREVYEDILKSADTYPTSAAYNRADHWS